MNDSSPATKFSATESTLKLPTMIDMFTTTWNNVTGFGACWIGFLLYDYLLRFCSVFKGIDNKPRKEHIREQWYYPPEIANDLQSVQLPFAVKEEIFACAWEYTRCVIPHYTNWPRYVAFMRIIVMGIIAEFRGELVDVAGSDDVLGYSLSDTLAALFEGTPGHVEMAREYRSFLLVTSQKARSQNNTVLFRRYVHALAKSPKQWFRMRDADALVRFTIASALACNDLDTMWFSNEQFEILTEIGDTLYDAVAYYKHRSEGETNSTFAYVPSTERVIAFRRAREALWALDVAWAHHPEKQCAINFVRFFGGPIHMMMRRYRFVEEDLTIGRPETEVVVAQTRKNVKLWHRVDSLLGRKSKKAAEEQRESMAQYHHFLAREEELMFPGLASFLDAPDMKLCTQCIYRDSYGAEVQHQFGGVQLCTRCKEHWRSYTESLLQRMARCFPEVAEIIQISQMRADTT